MAAVPVILNGVMAPKGKAAGDKPVPAVFAGYLSIAGLEVGGGPIIPAPEPPGEPTHPIVLPPDPVDPPIDPPTTPPSGSTVVVIKPAPATGGWGVACNPDGTNLTWFYVPGAGGAGPKK
jgi:hypothetical protein